MDLRLDIEHRKKYCCQGSHCNHDHDRDRGDSQACGREKPAENSSTSHERAKKSQRKRSRSSSSSSSSSSEPQQEDSFAAKSNPEDKSFHTARAGQNETSLERGKPHGGIQVRVRGRGWNRISFQGNSSHSNNVTNTSANPSKVEWDPEYTPKSRNYYLHDNREDEKDLTWGENRGRGRGTFLRGRARFIIRKATGGPNNASHKWAHDKFQVDGNQGAVKAIGQDHREGGAVGKHT